MPPFFSGKGVLAIFDKYFGPWEERNLSEVCAVSFVAKTTELLSLSLELLPPPALYQLP